MDLALWKEPLKKTRAFLKEEIQSMRWSMEGDTQQEPESGLQKLSVVLRKQIINKKGPQSYGFEELRFFQNLEVARNFTDVDAPS